MYKTMPNDSILTLICRSFSRHLFYRLCPFILITTLKHTTYDYDKEKLNENCCGGYMSSCSLSHFVMVCIIFLFVFDWLLASQINYPFSPLFQTSLLFVLFGIIFSCFEDHEKIQLFVVQTSEEGFV